ncbi:MAG TPA: hypothetical protein PLY80_16190 [Pseudomonadota bacterium]|jgi:hypothetical protein|nr:hypothetical protein [Pseudomonadota bacterium]
MMSRFVSTLCALCGLVALSQTTTAKAEAPQEIPAADRAKTTVCTDGKLHYVVMAPDERLISALFYGNDKQLYRVPAESSGMLSGGHFLEPRFIAATKNPSFRGVDMRIYSEVVVDKEKSTCEVYCGERKVALQVVPADKATQLLSTAKFVENPRQFVPYALARDERGTYYYVDRGATPITASRFRLFRGPRGNLKLQQMVNVVNDSEGDVFSTKSGSLRMILDKRESAWVENQKPSKLTLVPVQQNLNVIYNDLGVYAGQRQGTPCDDL